MKRACVVVFLFVLLAVHAKAANLSGTWVGKAVTPNGDDQVTLVLKKLEEES